MDDNTPVLQLPPTVFPELPNLSEITKSFWNELLGLGELKRTPLGGDSMDLGGKPWK
jgi:hypothetical protein